MPWPEEDWPVCVAVGGVIALVMVVGVLTLLEIGRFLR